MRIDAGTAIGRLLLVALADASSDDVDRGHTRTNVPIQAEPPKPQKDSRFGRGQRAMTEKGSRINEDGTFPGDQYLIYDNASLRSMGTPTPSDGLKPTEACITEIKIHYDVSNGDDVLDSWVQMSKNHSAVIERCAHEDCNSTVREHELLHSYTHNQVEYHIVAFYHDDKRQMIIKPKQHYPPEPQSLVDLTEGLRHGGRLASHLLGEWIGRRKFRKLNFKVNRKYDRDPVQVLAVNIGDYAKLKHLHAHCMFEEAFATVVLGLQDWSWQCQYRANDSGWMLQAEFEKMAANVVEMAANMVTKAEMKTMGDEMKANMVTKEDMKEVTLMMKVFVAIGLTLIAVMFFQ